MALKPRDGEKIFRGIPVSAGVCRGKALVLSEGQDHLPHYSISAEQVQSEIHRLQLALVETRKQIQEIQRRVSEAMGSEDATIFEAHLLVLEDHVLLDEVMRMIREERMNAEYAFNAVADKYASTLGKIEDEYLRERVADMKDVTSRILSNLLGRPNQLDLGHLQEPVIIVSHDLTPSTTAQLDRKKVLGFITEVGSRTSHTAILARSLNLPAVVGLPRFSEKLATGQFVLLDGFNGYVIISPTDQTLFEYGQLVRKQADLEERLLDLRDKPAVTVDGKQVMLSANLEQPGDTDQVIAYGAEGVGLFRTEYLFINRNTLPTEEEQYDAYRIVAAALKPHPVVIRTLDLGGDKLLSHLHIPQEMNPFLGWRAIRFCLQERDIFRNQLRAILRASVEGNVRMMYPMVSGLNEFNQANELLEAYRQELKKERIPFDPEMKVGVMVEIPSAVMIADSLAKQADFFSIGTNDLMQYSLAVDRLNDRIAHLYEPTHPAILRLIKMTVNAAHANGIEAGVCGEMAGDPELIPLLLGLGVDELSVAAPVVPKIKFLIRRLKMQEACELAEFALHCDSPGEILGRSQKLVRHVAPALFESEKKKQSLPNA